MRNLVEIRRDLVSLDRDVNAFLAQREALAKRLVRIATETCDMLGEEIKASSNGKVKRGPGRPRKAEAETTEKPKRGRPKGSKNKPKTGAKAARKGPRKTGLTDFLRAKVKKGPKSVADLIKVCEKNGFKTGISGSVIRLMVGKAKDLKLTDGNTVSAA